ncbi:MAG: cytochrome c biogenesis heme-transporting ATPase CcmA [Gammaproteobacteria bacterium]|nr:cytochrome c biogenesis heme-transporting ATPase CcmA [Gammaproteobacteria bacterium]
MLSAVNLTLWRGYQCLFENLSFSVGAGEGLLIRGRNGSGKTTLLRVLCGLTRPEAGEVWWRDEPTERCRLEFGRELAWCGHHTGLKTDLSIAQNLEFAASFADLAPDCWREPVAELGLENSLSLPVRYLSAGQQRRAALARVLISPARLWIMDEPFANLDVAGRGYIEARLAGHLAGGGLAVLAAHHDLADSGAFRRLQLGDSE